MSSFSGTQISDLADILKDQYRDPIIETLNNTNLLDYLLDDTDEYFQGSQIVIPLHTGRNEGIGARQEASNASALLPEAGSQGYKNAKYDVTHMYGRMAFTGQVIAKARNDEGAFANAIDSEVNGMTNDLAREMNFQRFYGKAGVRGSVDTTPTTTTITVDNVKFFRPGMLVDIIDNSPSSPTVRNGSTPVRISSVNKANTTITVDSLPNGVVADDIITRHKSYSNELFGLEDLISDSNPNLVDAGRDDITKYVGGLNRTLPANDFWKSIVVANAGAFGSTMFQDMIDEVHIESGEDLDFFVTTFDIYNKYAAEMLPDRRYNLNEGKLGKLDAAWGDLMYNGIPVLKDRDCQSGTIWGINKSRILTFSMSDWDYMDMDGSILSRIPNRDAYEATLFKYAEQGITNPSACAKTSGVTV